MIAENVEGLVFCRKSKKKGGAAADSAGKAYSSSKISPRTAGIVAVGIIGLLGIALLDQIRENQGIRESCADYEELKNMEKANSIIDVPHAREIKRRFMGLDAGCRSEVLDFVEKNKACAIKAINLCG